MFQYMAATPPPLICESTETQILLIREAGIFSSSLSRGNHAKITDNDFRKKKSVISRNINKKPIRKHPHGLKRHYKFAIFFRSAYGAMSTLNFV